jgi:hypothetical protein
MIDACLCARVIEAKHVLLEYEILDVGRAMLYAGTDDVAFVEEDARLGRHWTSVEEVYSASWRTQELTKDDT